MVLEDEEGPRQAAGTILKDFGYSEIRSPDVVGANCTGDVKAIVNAFKDRPAVAFIDLVWRNPRGARAQYELNARDLVAKALDKVEWEGPPVPTFIVTAYRLGEDVQLEQLREWRNAVAPKLNVLDVVGKPLTREKLWPLLRPLSDVATDGVNPLVEDEIFSINLDIRKLGIPARILDPDREVSISNDAWSWPKDEPEPEEDQQDYYAFLVPRGTKGPSDDKNRRADLPAYRLRESEQLNDERILQIAHAIEFDESLSGALAKEHFLKELFEAVSQWGFRRMRYYERRRVPCELPNMVYDDVNQLELIEWLPSSETIYPTLFGLREEAREFDAQDQELSDGISRFDQLSPPHELTYELSAPGKSAKSRSHYTTITDTDDRYVRLRVPIFRYEVLKDGGTKYFAEALLVLDRQGDTERPHVEERDVEHIEVPLLAACRRLRRLHKEERARKEVETIELIRNEYRTLLRRSTKATEAENKFALGFVQLAIKLTGAREGALCWSRHPDHVPVVLAHSDSSKRWLDGTPVSQGEMLQAKRHPAAWQAWQTREEVFLQRYTHPNIRNDMGSQSRIAFPLVVGNEIFGVISLMHPSHLHFRLRDIEAMRQLVEIFVYPLYYALERNDRRTWEQGLAHELRTNMAGVKNELIALRDDLHVPDDHKYLVGARVNNQKTLDIANCILDLLRDKVSGEMSPFAGEVAVRDELTDLREPAGDENIVFVDRLRAESSILHGDENVFRRIVRVLMHNTIRHGDPGRRVTIISEAAGETWRLRVLNSGQMSDEEQRTIWIPHYRSRSRKGSGAHVGLATALKWVQASGATIDVRNRYNNRVEAILEWPYDTKKKRRGGPRKK